MANDCYNCENLETHERFGTVCAAPRAGGIDAAVLVLCGETVADPSDGAELNTLIDGDGARLVEQVSIGIDGAEQVLSQFTVTPCDQPRVLYVNFTGALRDLAFTRQNMIFYNRLIAGYKVSAMIGRLCTTDGWDEESVYLNGTMSFAGNPLIPIDGTDTDRFELTFTFRGEMTLIDTPTGVFDQ